MRWPRTDTFRLAVCARTGGGGGGGENAGGGGGELNDCRGGGANDGGGGGAGGTACTASKPILNCSAPPPQAASPATPARSSPFRTGLRSRAMAGIDCHRPRPDGRSACGLVSVDRRGWSIPLGVLRAAARRSSAHFWSLARPWGRPHRVASDRRREPKAGIGGRRGLVEAAGMVFQRYAIRDHSVPDDPAGAITFAYDTFRHLTEGHGVVLHCFAGIGRSGLMAILTLMIGGYALRDAQRRASLARGFAVPENRLQRRWLAAAETWLQRNSGASGHEG